MRRPLALCLAVLAAMAVTAASPTSAGALETRSPSLLMKLLDDRIDESSGLETAADFPGVVYTHNDSGDSARFFAVGKDGVTKAVYTLPGAAARDWEDMSEGRNKSLWFGDIGDNHRQRDYVSVYRVDQPARLANAKLSSTRYDFKYADGASHNAEALLVNPETGTLYIATKQKSGAGLYRAPASLSTSGYNKLTRVTGVPPVVTGGNFSPNGERLVLRTYSDAYVYRSIGGTPNIVDLPVHGESVTFTRDNVDLLVGREGSDSPVWRVPIN